MLLEKARGPTPGKFGRLAVMDRHALFIDKGVIGARS
jgi:hypothetical protein